MLKAILKLIIKRKGLLIFSIIAAICVALLININSKPVFESKVTFVIGKIGGVVGGTGEIDNTKALMQRIIFKYDVGVKDRSLPAVVSVEANRVFADYITISVRANTPKDAREYLNNVLADIMVEQTRLFEKLKGHKKEDLAYLHSKLIELQNMHASAEQSDRARILKLEMETKSNISKAELYLLDPYTMPSRIIVEPSEPQLIKTISILQLLGAALLNGIILGLVLIMIADIPWRERTREFITRLGMKS